ncbi:unnamed protein product [Lampetra fluviatilis]
MTVAARRGLHAAVLKAARVVVPRSRADSPPAPMPNPHVGGAAWMKSAPHSTEKHGTARYGSARLGPARVGSLGRAATAGAWREAGARGGAGAGIRCLVLFSRRAEFYCRWRQWRRWRSPGRGPTSGGFVGVCALRVSLLLLARESLSSSLPVMIRGLDESRAGGRESGTRTSLLGESRLCAQVDAEVVPGESILELIGESPQHCSPRDRPRHSAAYLARQAASNPRISPKT